MSEVLDKTLLDFIYQANSCLTLDELNIWSIKLSEFPDESLTYLFSNKRIDIVQLNDEFLSYSYHGEDILTFIQYIEKYYSEAIKLILRIPDIEKHCFDKSYNMKQTFFFIKEKEKPTVYHAQNFLYYIQNNVRK
ncbi:hypothetical protein [Enterococcus innesii]|uniref:hypothetical protein n=1 Tax=Enterococcus innesii TaxID=2839759 RepID=UPI001FCAE991|nr:hypothetical protein [Enterococcus innesii]